MPDTASKHVHEGIASVARALAEEGISKTRQNKEQNFRFRGIDDVLNELSPLLARYKLLVSPAFTQRECVQRTSRSGATIFNVSVSGVFTITSLVDGSSLEAGPFIGEAMDMADKATNKAMSAAYKYFAILTFCIPITGADFSDSDAEPAPKVATMEDVQRMQEAERAEEDTRRQADRIKSLATAKTVDELQTAYVTAYRAANAAERKMLERVKDQRKKELAPPPKAVEDVDPEDPKATPPSRRGPGRPKKEAQE